MKKPTCPAKHAPFMAWIAACLGAVIAVAAHAATEPAQKPLMNAVAGAVPNVMLNLDNSGSMTWPFLDSYPLLDSSYENAMRSSTVNPMYYNPRIYYAPRVNADGSAWVSPAGNATVGSNCNNTSITTITAPTEPPGRLTRPSILLQIPMNPVREGPVNSGPGRPIIILPPTGVCPNIGNFPSPAPIRSPVSTFGMSPTAPRWRIAIPPIPPSARWWMFIRVV